MAVKERSLMPALEQGVARDEPLILKDADFVGKAVDLDDAPPGRVGD
jgi:hypothetical protein